MPDSGRSHSFQIRWTRTEVPVRWIQIRGRSDSGPDNWPEAISVASISSGCLSASAASLANVSRFAWLIASLLMRRHFSASSKRSVQFRLLRLSFHFLVQEPIARSRSTARTGFRSRRSIRRKQFAIWNEGAQRRFHCRWLPGQALYFVSSTERSRPDVPKENPAGAGLGGGSTKHQQRYSRAGSRETLMVLVLARGSSSANPTRRAQTGSDYNSDRSPCVTTHASPPALNASRAFNVASNESASSHSKKKAFALQRSSSHHGLLARRRPRSPLSQPMTFSSLRGSSRSQLGHCNTRGPRALGGLTIIIGCPHVGQSRFCRSCPIRGVSARFRQKSSRFRARRVPRRNSIATTLEAWAWNPINSVAATG